VFPGIALTASLFSPDRPAPLLCLVSRSAWSTDRLDAARRGLPPDLDVCVARAAGDAISTDIDAVLLDIATHADLACAALRAVAARWPGRDALVLDVDAVLPTAWWPRLRAAAGGDSSASVFSPLTTGDIDPASLVAGDNAAVIALDARLRAVSDQATLPANSWSPALSYWRADALAHSDASARDGELPVGVTGHRLDHLCVGASDSLAQDLPAVRALRTRLETLGEQPLPLHGLDGKPVVLHVLHGWGGGAARFVEDLARADSERHHLVLVSRGSSTRRCHGEQLALHADLHAVPIRTWPLSAPIAASVGTSAEYRAIFAQVQRDFCVGAVLVSSLIGHSFDALRTGLPTAVVCHDYYPLWPRLHADFDDTARDFSVAAIPAALRDVRNFEFAERRPAMWQALRRDYLAALTDADATLIAPSETVRNNLQRIEPALAQRPWRHIEHGFAPFPHTDAAIGPDPERSALRIVVVGRINGAKGEHLLAELIPRLPQGVELVLLGGGAAAMRFFGQRGVHVLLNYDRDDLPGLLARLRPDAALLASTVAETYSYTLSELWSLGVPVIATQLGSFAERIADGRTGLLVEPDAEALAQMLATLRDDRSPLDALRAEPRAALPTLATMAQAYRSTLVPAMSAVAAPTFASLAAASHRHEADAAKFAAELRDAEARLVARQRDLEQRADWALAQERIARDRTRWARALEQQAQELTALSKDLQREIDARGAWAHTLLAETERLKSLVASEQQRLEAELHERDATVRREQQAHGETRALLAPRASIVVPVYNQLHHTGPASRRSPTTDGSVQLRSHRGRRWELERRNRRAKCRRSAACASTNPQNLGFIGACNAGAALARGSTCLPQQRHRGAAGLAGTTARQLRPVRARRPGRLQTDLSRRPAAGSRRHRVQRRLGLELRPLRRPADDPRYNYVREVDYCSGAAMPATRTLFEQLRRLRQPVQAGLLRRHRPRLQGARGRPARAVPAGVEVVHFEGVTGGTDTSSGTKRYQVINQQKFLERWKDALAEAAGTGHRPSRASRARASREARADDRCHHAAAGPGFGFGALVNLMRCCLRARLAVHLLRRQPRLRPRYTEDLQQLGVEVLHGPWLSEPVRFFARERRAVRRDHAQPALRRRRHYVGLARLHAPQATRAVRHRRPALPARAARGRRSSREALATAGRSHARGRTGLIRSCDVTLVVSPVEQELLRAKRPVRRVEVLSNVHEVFGRRAGFGERKDLMFVGGFQHPPNVDAVRPGSCRDLATRARALP
jgi:glycosyltransferase involved in cell wall biosynthesis